MAKAINKTADEPVYSATIRLKNGRVLVAAHYGLKAFVFYPKNPKR